MIFFTLFWISFGFLGPLGIIPFFGIPYLLGSTFYNVKKNLPRAGGSTHFAILSLTLSALIFTWPVEPLGIWIHVVPIPLGVIYTCTYIFWVGRKEKNPAPPGRMETALWYLPLVTFVGSLPGCWYIFGNYIAS